MTESWPERDEQEEDARAAAAFEKIQAIVSGIRNVRSEYNVAPGKDIAASLSVPANSDDLQSAFEEHRGYFARLARVSELTIGIDMERPPASAAVVVGKLQVHIPLAGMIDLDVERERLQKEIDQKERFLVGVQRKLQNQQFVERAPEDVVMKERAKERDASAELARLRANLEELSA